VAHPIKGNFPVAFRSAVSISIYILRSENNRKVLDSATWEGFPKVLDTLDTASKTTTFGRKHSHAENGLARDERSMRPTPQCLLNYRVGSLRIQPPLIRSCYYVRNTKTDDVGRFSRFCDKSATCNREVTIATTVFRDLHTGRPHMICLDF